MNWKFWERREDTSLVEQLRGERDTNADIAREFSARLKLARRRLARPNYEGMTDAALLDAFSGLLDHAGFEAILQIITDRELKAVDDMTEDKASFADMKKAAGAVAALSNLHHQLIQLETEARQRAAKNL